MFWSFANVVAKFLSWWVFQNLAEQSHLNYPQQDFQIHVKPISFDAGDYLESIGVLQFLLGGMLCIGPNWNYPSGETEAVQFVDEIFKNCIFDRQYKHFRGQ